MESDDGSAPDRGARFESAAPDGRGWNLVLEHLLRRHVATQLEEVCPVLAQADAAARRGEWAAVVVSYEAAGAFDRAMRAPSADHGPLVQVNVYQSGRAMENDDARRHAPSRPDVHDAGAFPCRPSIDADAFGSWVRAAQDRILDGDIYQVNLTFPLTAVNGHEVEGAFRRLCEAQQAPYCACLRTEDHIIVSLSPELFFSRVGNTVVMRPMKGTSRRGRWLAEDEARARALVESPKERAENVMIVDVMRNDIGRLACVGTVSVPSMYEVERYPTLWQMTSTVQASVPSEASTVDLFRALFPSGSVTGAPKVRAMEIIAEHEQAPRGVYTGAIGYVAPGGDCAFNVAIRTIVVDRHTGRATMGVGAGITADSIAGDEYRECLLKADFLAHGTAETTGDDFALVETMRLEDGVIPRLSRHLERMKGSARYFSYAWRDADVREAVAEAVRGHAAGLWRLRLTLDRQGTPAIACTLHRDAADRVCRVARASSPIDSDDPFLFNKTTRRGVYEAARSERVDVDDVLLWNSRGEVTESTIANVVVEIEGRRYTPPIDCGVLPGTFRGELVEQGAVLERRLTFDDLGSASRMWLVNSLRGWVEATLVP